MGRLKPGVSEERARAEIELLMRQAILDYKPDREYDSAQRVALIPGGQGLDRVRNTLEQPFRILAWAVGAASGDRLREHRGIAAGEGDGTPPRNWDTVGHRGEPRTPGPATAHREPALVRIRRGCGRSPGRTSRETQSPAYS